MDLASPALEDSDSALPNTFHRPTTIAPGRRKTLKRLRPLDYKSVQQKNLSLAYEGTGTWFLDSSEFQSWERNGGLLFAEGAPGAGKTVMSSMVVDHLTRKHAFDHDTGVAYFHFDFKQQYTSQGVLASLIEQLCLPALCTQQAIDDIFRGEKVLRKATSLAPVLDLVVSHIRKAYVILDALDECPRWENGSGNPFLMTTIGRLMATGTISVFVTSRLNPDLEESLACFSPRVMEFRPPLQDFITEILKRQMPRLPSFVADDQTMQQNVATIISDASDGMFLATSKMLDALMAERTHIGFGSILDSIAQGTFSISTIYEETVSRIDALEPYLCDLAKHVIIWLAFAARPLTLLELQFAVHMRLEEPVVEEEPLVDEEKITHLRHILSACTGLVKFDQETSVVGFAHQSARYFFRTTDYIPWIQNADNVIANACATYLWSPTMDYRVCATDQEIEDRLLSQPLYQYASCYWGDHASNMEQLSDEVKLLLGNLNALEASIQIPLSDASQRYHCKETPRRVTALHVAAHFGMANAVAYLLDNGASPHLKDSHGRTPLWWAAIAEQEGTTEKLCQVDTTTLHLLLSYGNLDMARQLVDSGYSLDTLDLRKRTPLHVAVTLDDRSFASALCRANSKLDIADVDGLTPLQLALRNCKFDMVQLLISNGAETKGLEAKEWRNAYKKSVRDHIHVVERADEDLYIEFLTHLSDPPAVLDLQRTGRKREFFQIDNFLLAQPWVLDRYYDVPGFFQVHGRELQEKQWAYSLTAFFSSVPAGYSIARRDDATSRSVRIAWNVCWCPDYNGMEHWETIKHYSNMPYVLVPANGAELLQYFVKQLEIEWRSVCQAYQLASHHLRSDLFRDKGSNPKSLDRLLEDAKTFIELRDALTNQTEIMTKFCIGYCRRHDETASLDELLESIKRFSEVTYARINQLDDTSKDLIQIEFNLASIAEARTSTSTSTSMARLSWITFVFMPLTFISSVFGMNVDVLANNPPWWLYLPFALGTFGITATVWMVLKKTGKIERHRQEQLQRRRTLEIESASTSSRTFSDYRLPWSRKGAMVEIFETRDDMEGIEKPSSFTTHVRHRNEWSV